MVISNNTKHASIYYSVSSKAGVDCGNLDPGDDATLSSFDDQADVKVTLTISKTGDDTEVAVSDPGL
jgi:hypothetical protein